MFNDYNVIKRLMAPLYRSIETLKQHIIDRMMNLRMITSVIKHWGWVFALLPLAVYADDDEKNTMFNPVEHAVISETIAPDARGAGMGDVGAATDPDVNSQYWNPAKYPFCISRAGIALNYTPWLRQLVNDIDLAYVAGYYRIGDYSAISGSLRYFSLGEVYTDYGVSDVTVKPYEMSIDAAYSLMLSETFSIAAAIRWIYSDLRFDYSEDSKPASAFAADLAMYYNNYLMLGNRECQLGLGMNIRNIGSKISYYGDEESQFIPANLRLGASLMVPVDDYNRFSFSADANKLLVPTVPRQEEGETNSEYQDRVRREYSDVGSTGNQTGDYRVLRRRNRKKGWQGIWRFAGYVF